MGDSNKRFKGQTLVLDGSRSGADIPQSKISYNSSHNAEYFGDSKFGASEDSPKWYIEKFMYNSAGNVVDCVTAINQIYSGVATVTVDSSGDPSILVTIVGLPQTLLDILHSNDIMNLTTVTNVNKIQGTITNIDKTTNIFTVLVGTSGIVNETSTIISATDCIFTLNNVEVKPFNKRVWSLRAQYLYK